MQIYFASLLLYILWKSFNQWYILFQKCLKAWATPGWFHVNPHYFDGEKEIINLVPFWLILESDESQNIYWKICHNLFQMCLSNSWMDSRQFQLLFEEKKWQYRDVNLINITVERFWREKSDQYSSSILIEKLKDFIGKQGFISPEIFYVSTWYFFKCLMKKICLKKWHSKFALFAIIWIPIIVIVAYSYSDVNYKPLIYADSVTRYMYLGINWWYSRISLNISLNKSPNEFLLKSHHLVI